MQIQESMKGGGGGGTTVHVYVGVWGHATHIIFEIFVP